MAGHEWTRARQRSVSGGATPAESVPKPPPEEPAEPVDGPHGDPAVEETETPATAPPVADPEPVATSAGTTEPESAAEGAEPEPVPESAPEAPAEPEAGHRAAEAGEIAHEAPAPPEGQATLPLGLDPLPTAPPKRTATETREDLIQRLLDPHLTLQETAKLLDVCPTTVRRYTNRGLLAHYRTPGNQRRFRLSDVLSFMERQGIPALGLERKRSDPGPYSGIEPEDAT